MSVQTGYFEWRIHVRAQAVYLKRQRHITTGLVVVATVAWYVRWGVEGEGALFNLPHHRNASDGFGHASSWMSVFGLVVDNTRRHPWCQQLTDAARHNHKRLYDFTTLQTLVSSGCFRRCSHGLQASHAQCTKRVDGAVARHKNLVSRSVLSTLSAGNRRHPCIGHCILPPQ